MGYYSNVRPAAIRIPVVRPARHRSNMMKSAHCWVFVLHACPVARWTRLPVGRYDRRSLESDLSVSLRCPSGRHLGWELAYGHHDGSEQRPAGRHQAGEDTDGGDAAVDILAVRPAHGTVLVANKVFQRQLHVILVNRPPTCTQLDPQDARIGTGGSMALCVVTCLPDSWNLMAPLSSNRADCAFSNTTPHHNPSPSTSVTADVVSTAIANALPGYDGPSTTAQYPPNVPEAP